MLQGEGMVFSEPLEARAKEGGQILPWSHKAQGSSKGLPTSRVTRWGTI